jgi:hypothetical protein
MTVVKTKRTGLTLERARSSGTPPVIRIVNTTTTVIPISTRHSAAGRPYLNGTKGVEAVSIVSKGEAAD